MNWNITWPRTASFPESSFPLTSGRKTRTLGATISGMRHRCRLRSETGWAESPEFDYFKMVAPRTLVFRPLTKGNEDSGNEIGPRRAQQAHAAKLTKYRWPVLAQKKFGESVRPASQNPYPIYDQNLWYSLPYLWRPKIRNPIYDLTLKSKPCFRPVL